MKQRKTEAPIIYDTSGGILSDGRTDQQKRLDDMMGDEALPVQFSDLRTAAGRSRVNREVTAFQMEKARKTALLFNALCGGRAKLGKADNDDERAVLDLNGRDTGVRIATDQVEEMGLIDPFTLIEDDVL